jgi:hypothetical protein
MIGRLNVLDIYTMSSTTTADIPYCSQASVAARATRYAPGGATAYGCLGQISYYKQATGGNDPTLTKKEAYAVAARSKRARQGFC